MKEIPFKDLKIGDTFYTIPNKKNPLIKINHNNFVSVYNKQIYPNTFDPKYSTVFYIEESTPTLKPVKFKDLKPGDEFNTQSGYFYKKINSNDFVHKMDNSHDVNCIDLSDNTVYWLPGNETVLVPQKEKGPKQDKEKSVLKFKQTVKYKDLKIGDEFYCDEYKYMKTNLNNGFNAVHLNEGYRGQFNYVIPERLVEVEKEVEPNSWYIVRLEDGCVRPVYCDSSGKEIYFVTKQKKNGNYMKVVEVLLKLDLSKYEKESE